MTQRTTQGVSQKQQGEGGNKAVMALITTKYTFQRDSQEEYPGVSCCEPGSDDVVMLLLIQCPDFQHHGGA